MSLMDTIKGAREEAADNAKSLGRNADAAATPAADAKPSSQGFTRASAASGKPARAAAAGVRVVTSDGRTKSKSQMTKEERKAERKREQEIEDQRYTLSEAMLKENDAYNRAHKVWMRFLIAGIVLMVAALSVYGVVQQQGEAAPQWMGILGIVIMVAAYVVVVLGIVYDWRKVKPLREEVQKRVTSMSTKRVRSALAKRAGKQ